MTKRAAFGKDALPRSYSEAVFQRCSDGAAAVCLQGRRIEMCGPLRIDPVSECMCPECAWACAVMDMNGTIAKDRSRDASCSWLRIDRFYRESEANSQYSDVCPSVTSCVQASASPWRAEEPGTESASGS